MIVFINSLIPNVNVMSNILSYQLKLIKVRAKLANLNHCAVPFLILLSLDDNGRLSWYKIEKDFYV